MFMQIIQGRVTDSDRFLAEAGRWPIDLKPGATGYLGCTWGVASDGTGFVAARFDSKEAATRNSQRPEQAAWWQRMAPAFGDVSFHDCTDVDTMVGGGSNEARFVQVIQGRAKDQAAARIMLRDSEGQLSEGRPDILGVVMAWHGDTGEFTQMVYFRSEQDARAGEGSATDDEVDNQYRDMMAVEPTFIDLTDPRFD